MDLETYRISLGTDLYLFLNLDRHALDEVRKKVIWNRLIQAGGQHWIGDSFRFPQPKSDTISALKDTLQDTLAADDSAVVVQADSSTNCTLFAFPRANEH